jgi:hypothetical protein
MSNITIQLPIIDAEHKIEIDVKINGQNKKYHYRVELFDWDECDVPEIKAVCLKKMIEHYEPGWNLVQIGEATNKNISVMFRENN